MILLSGQAFLKAQDAIEINSEIKKVTVFQQGAQISRSGSANLTAGVHELIFPYLAQNLDPASIQLRSNSAITILSITHRNNFLNEENLPEKIQKLQDQVDDLNKQLQQINAEEEALKEEKEMILANRKVGGEQVALNVQQLSQVAAYFSKRIREINLALIEIQERKKELSEERNRLQKQLQQERQAFSKRTGQVVVSVDVPRASVFQFDLLYMVSSVSWYSTYDARVDDLSQPVELTHKAMINQQSGEDWNNVELILATGNPSAGAQVPYMNPWYVNFNDQKIYLDGVQTRGSISSMDANTIFKARKVEVAEADAAVYQDFSINQNITQQEYTVDRKQNIPSSTSPATVVLREISLPARYEYHAKPRLDKDAFLIAKVYDWGRFDLLNGEISLFNNNTFVGKAFLNTQNPDDTLQLSLGRDQNVVISRTRIYNKQEKSFFGNNRIDLFTWKIEIRNNKKVAVDLILRDQVPVSQNEDIKVDIKEMSGGKLEEKSGIIKWRLNLNPGQRLEKIVSYELKYPKDKQLNYY
ncbi:MAG: mucoidy inhibitor MuiA family protein [Owenweeksia sp.]